MTRTILGVAGSLAAALAFGPVVSAAPAPDPTFGDWLTVGGAAKVRMGACAGNPALACGTLLWLKAGAAVRDVNNPDEGQRTRSLVGVLLLSDLRREGAGQWTDGKIYVPETGRTARAKMTANSDGTLKVEGCVAVICQARTWTRAN